MIILGNFKINKIIFNPMPIKLLKKVRNETSMSLRSIAFTAITLICCSPVSMSLTPILIKMCSPVYIDQRLTIHNDLLRGSYYVPTPNLWIGTSSIHCAKNDNM